MEVVYEQVESNCAFHGAHDRTIVSSPVIYIVYKALYMPSLGQKKPRVARQGFFPNKVNTNVRVGEVCLGSVGLPEPHYVWPCHLTCVTNVMIWISAGRAYGFTLACCDCRFTAVRACLHMGVVAWLVTLERCGAITHVAVCSIQRTRCNSIMTSSFQVSLPFCSRMRMRYVEIPKMSHFGLCNSLGGSMGWAGFCQVFI